MKGYPAATAKTSRRLTVAAGDPFRMILDLPAIDNLDGGELAIQRGHFLVTLSAPTAGTAARRSVEWRLTTRGRDATVVSRGKIGSSNVNGASGLVEPPRQGGVLIPVFGGVVLELADYHMTALDTVTAQAIYVAGHQSGETSEWPVSYRAVLASDAAPATPGPFVELGPPPMGATRLQILAPDVANDAGAPGPLEMEWIHADGTRAAPLDFLTEPTSMRLAPQGYHARIRTGGAYGASGFAPQVLINWS